MTTRWTLILAMLCMSQLAFAQDGLDDLVDREMGLPDASDPLLDDSPADAAITPPPPSDDDIAAILNELTPEQLEELVKAAAAQRLRVERQTALAEMMQNILYEEDALKQAASILITDPADTQADNIRRICKAYATVDDRFAQPWKLHEAGEHKKVVELLGKQLNPEDISYLSAAMHYAYADSLRQLERPWDAIDAYTQVLVNLPDRISFASAAAQASARLYEQMHRGMYAMEMYVYCLRNYSLTMTKQEVDAMLERFDELKAIYADPLAAASEMMEASEAMLAKAELGEAAQAKQEEVIALLEDLIKTAEEKQRQQQQQQQQRQRQRREQAGQEKKQQEGQAQQQKKQGQQPGQNPTSPMEDSSLVPGPLSQPNRLSMETSGKESERWADMPPRQREKMQNLMRQRLGERRGDLVRDYHRKLAEGE